MTTALATYNPAMPIRQASNALAMFQERVTELGSVIPEGAALTVSLVVDSAMNLLSAPGKAGDGLRNCTGESIYQCVKDAASFGLSFHKVLNLAHLVPYKNTCTLIVGYGGLLDLVTRACELQSVDAQVVYDGDQIEILQGSEPDVIHRPSLTVSRDPKNIVGAYFVAMLPSGQKKVEWMSKSEIDGIRRRSIAANSGPWVTDYAEMARKTVIRRGQKLLPKSVSKASILLAKAIDREDSQTGLAELAKPVSSEDRTAALRAKLAGRTAQESPAAPQDHEVIEVDATDARSEELPLEAPEPAPVTADEVAQVVAAYKVRYPGATADQFAAWCTDEAGEVRHWRQAESWTPGLLAQCMEKLT